MKIQRWWRRLKIRFPSQQTRVAKNILKYDAKKNENQSVTKTLKQAKKKLIIDLNKLNHIQTILLEKVSHKNEILNNREDFEANTREKSSGEWSEEYFKSILARYLSSTPNRQKKDRDNECNESESTNYRLIKLDNLSLMKNKEAYVYDLIQEKVAGYNSVRQLKMETHKKMKEMNSSVKIIDSQSREFETNDQRFFQKVYANMTFGSLSAVDKAYAERNDEKKHKNVQRLVRLIRDIDEQAAQQVNYFKTHKGNDAREKREDDKKRYELGKQKINNDRNELVNKVQESREKLEVTRNKRKRDIQLAIEFSKQHLSVSKALQRHEFISSKEARIQKNSKFVEAKKSEEDVQRELIKTYLEKRNALRRDQALKEKHWIEARIKEDLTNAQEEVRIRVDSLREDVGESRKKSTKKTNSAATILFYKFAP